MKILKKTLSLLLVAALIMSVVAACKKKEDEDDRVRDNIDGDDNYGTFSYGVGLDENGYLEGITARDYVGSFDYIGLEIPAESLEISEEDVDNMLSSQTAGTFPDEEDRITDRAVEKGDLVNIDFLGSVDGVEFDGGNSRAFDDQGMNVVAGSKDFVADFLTQIIGSSPGDTIDVNVTFPEDYTEELAGKDALFVVDIHYIIDTKKMKEDIREELKKNAIAKYVMNFIENTPAEVPDGLIALLEENTINFYAQSAREAGMSINDYIEEIGFESIEDLLADEREGLLSHARIQLVIQAIAEDLQMKITDDDVRDYLAEVGVSDMDDAVEVYSMPYLKQVVMHDTILKHITDEAILPDGDSVQDDEESVDEDDDSGETEDEE